MENRNIVSKPHHPPVADKTLPAVVNLKFNNDKGGESTSAKAKANINYAPINRSNMSPTSGNFQLPLSTDSQVNTRNRVKLLSSLLLDNLKKIHGHLLAYSTVYQLPSS